MGDNVVIVVPTERESRALRERGVRVEHCGVGMAECAAATAQIIAEERPSSMILAGIAGTYSDDLAIGETVIVASETVADLGRLSATGFTPMFRKEYVSRPHALGSLCGFRVVRSHTVSTAGWTPGTRFGTADAARFGTADAEIENMEGAAFFAVCARFGVSALEVRTISNRVGHRINPCDLNLSVSHLALSLEKILASLA